MNYSDPIKTFHGTSDDVAEKLLNGHIDVAKGGGELGQGFYLGDKLHIAKAWAKNRHGSEAVIEVNMGEDDFYSFDIECLNQQETVEARENIKKLSQSRSYHFGCDMVWAPIVGGSDIYADQHKWESKNGENFLNGSKVLRRKI